MDEVAQGKYSEIRFWLRSRDQFREIGRIRVDNTCVATHNRCMNKSNPKKLQHELGKVHPFDIPEQEAYLNLVRTTGLLSREFLRLFREHGLSESQYNVMRIVAGAGRKGIRMELIGEQMVSHDPDTTRLIARLESAGLVKRSRYEDDRRCFVVQVTEAGKRALKKLRKEVDDLHVAQLGHMNKGELSKLNALLMRARDR